MAVMTAARMVARLAGDALEHHVAGRAAADRGEGAEQGGGQPAETGFECFLRSSCSPQAEGGGVKGDENPVPAAPGDIEDEGQTGPGQRSGDIGRINEGGRRSVLEQQVADYAAAEPGYRPDHDIPEQVQSVAARPPRRARRWRTHRPGPGPC